MATMLPIAEPARTRIIRLTNVHFEANDDVIQQFFREFIIEDQFRTVNSRTGVKSIVYVLFATVIDRIRACGRSGYKILDRTINIQPAPTGNYQLNKDETAFVPTVGTETRKADVSPGITSYEYDDADFPKFDQVKGKTIAQMKTAEISGIRSPPIMSSNNDLTTSCNETTHQSTHQPTVEDVADDEDEAHGLYESTTGNVESNHEFEEPPEATLSDCTNTTPDLRLCGISVGGGDESAAPSETQFPTFEINMTIPPRPENWNLAGHDAWDPAFNILTEAKWYSFWDDVAVKVKQDLKNDGTNTRRLLNDAGGYGE